MSNDERARAIVETLLRDELIELASVRGRDSLSEALAAFLDEPRATPSGPALSEWLVEQREVSELFADDPTLEALLKKAPAADPAFQTNDLPINIDELHRDGDHWETGIDIDLGAGNPLLASVFIKNAGEGRPGEATFEHLARIVGGFPEMWTRIAGAVVDTASDLESATELVAGIDSISIHLDAHEHHKWTAQVRYGRDGEMGYLVDIQNDRVVGIVGVD